MMLAEALFIAHSDKGMVNGAVSDVKCPGYCVYIVLRYVLCSVPTEGSPQRLGS